MAQTVECIACGHVGQPKTKGSFAITIILLFIGLLPGIIYEIWRRSGGKVCSACGSHGVRLYVPTPRQFQPKVNEVDFTQPVVSKGKTAPVAHDVFSYNAGKRMQLDENGVEQKNCPDCMELIRFDARKCKHCGSMVEQ